MSRAKKTGGGDDTRKARANTPARQDTAKAELRETILAAARGLVLEEGFASLSIRKLAERIGYAPGTIYLYFKDRDGLVRELCVRGFAALSEEMKLRSNVADPRKRVVALLRAYAGFALDNPETYRLSFMEDPKFAAEMLRAEPLEGEDGAGTQAFALLIEALRGMKRAKEIAAGEDLNLLAEVLWAGVHGVVSLKLIYPAFPANSVERLIDKLTGTVLTGAGRAKSKA